MKQTSDKLDSFLHRKLADLQVGEEGDAGWDQIYKDLEAAGAYKAKSGKMWYWSAALLTVITAAVLWFYLPSEENSSSETATITETTVSNSSMAEAGNTRTSKDAGVQSTAAPVHSNDVVTNGSATGLANRINSSPSTSNSNSASVSNSVSASPTFRRLNNLFGNSGADLGWVNRHNQGITNPDSGSQNGNSEGTTTSDDRNLNPVAVEDDPKTATGKTGDTTSVQAQNLGPVNYDSSTVAPNIKPLPPAAKTRKWHLYAGLNYEMAFFLQHPQAGNLDPRYVHEDYYSHTKDAARRASASSFGLNLSLNHNSGFRFITGIGISRKALAFDFDFKNHKVPVVDSADQILGYLEVKPSANNPNMGNVAFTSRQTFDYYTIPVGIGYTFRLPKFLLGVEAGADFLFLKDFQGTELDPLSLTSRSFSGATPLRRVNYGFWISPQLAYSLNPKLALTVQPRYTHMLYSVFENSHPYQFKPSSLGLQFGLKYQLF